MRDLADDGLAAGRLPLAGRLTPFLAPDRVAGRLAGRGVGRAGASSSDAGGAASSSEGSSTASHRGQTAASSATLLLQEGHSIAGAV
jgi:hypothetical protein